MSDKKSEVPARISDLDDGPVDSWLILLKGVIGGIPVGGSLLAELLGGVLPGQRLDRVVDVLRRLELRFETVEELVQKLRSSEDAADLLYQGTQDAASAKAPDRRERIAKIMAEGIKKDAASALQASRLLRLMAQLDDQQIAWLIKKWLKEQEIPARQRTYFLDPADAEEFKGFEIQEMARLGLFETKQEGFRTGKDHIREQNTARWKTVGSRREPRESGRDFYLSRMALEFLKQMELTKGVDEVSMDIPSS